MLGVPVTDKQPVLDLVCCARAVVALPCAPLVDVVQEPVQRGIAKPQSFQGGLCAFGRDTLEKREERGGWTRRLAAGDTAFCLCIGLSLLLLPTIFVQSIAWCVL